MANITLKGSERVAMPGARVVAPADPTERLEVTVLVRRRAGEALHARAAQLAAGNASARLPEPRGICGTRMAPMPPTWQRCALSRQRMGSSWCWSMRRGEP